MLLKKYKFLTKYLELLYKSDMLSHTAYDKILDILYDESEETWD